MRLRRQAEMAEIRKRLVVYTVLTGSKEPLGNPLSKLAPGAQSDLDISFVCFTDNRKLSSDVWEFRYIDDVPLPPEKLSRRPKALPHEYLKEWDYSLYIDNIVVFKRLPQAADLQTNSAYLFKVFKHATRSNPKEEAEVIVAMGYESVDRICTQLDYYSHQFPISSISPLSTCTVILRQHNHPTLIAFGRTWWEQILNFCKRDQMSFDFAVKWTRAHLEYFTGLKHDNDLIQNTANMGGNRVLSNFDAKKYSWIHKGEPAALANPRQHYLDHGQHTGRDYAGRVGILEYLSYIFASSLGTQVSPRRCMAEPLQDLLQSRRHAGGRMLLLRIRDQGTSAFSNEELDSAEKVLCAFLPSHAGMRIDIESTQLATGKLAFPTMKDEFDVVLVIGVPGPLLPQTYALISSKLKTSDGLMCILASQPCAAAEIARIETDLGKHPGVVCQSSIHSSFHDSLDAPLRNSLVALEWMTR